MGSDEDDFEARAKLLAAALCDVRLLLGPGSQRPDGEASNQAAALAYALHNDALALLEGRDFDLDAVWRQLAMVDSRLGTGFSDRLRFHIETSARLGAREPMGYGAQIKVIDRQPPEDVYALWERVREHPWAMLDAPTLSALRTFWMAYQTALRHHGIELPMGSPTFRHFPWWIAARRGEPLHTGGWHHFLALEHSDEDGFQAFFEELDEFRSRSLVEIASADVAEVIHPHRAVTVSPEGTEIEEPIQPVVRVRLLAYAPDDAVVAELTRTMGPPDLEWVGDCACAEKWCRANLHVDVTATLEHAAPS